MASAGFQAVNARSGSQNSGRLGGAAPHTAQSQPGTTFAVAPSRSQTPQSSANAQQPPAPSGGIDNMMAEAATYGTRSRNRAGNARINYAEDQEMDFEFSSAATATSKKKSANEPSHAGHETTINGQRATNGARSNDKTSEKQKDSTPAASTEPAPLSKKRKAAGSLSQQAQTPPSSSAPAPSVAMRKFAASAAAGTTMARETNLMTFTKHKSCLNKKGELVADDGTKLCVNDHVYLVCEPPGEPYYLCRIMEFLHVDNDNPSSPVDSIRVNWYYRPRDVQRFNSDSRLVYATMHSDMCPITSLRGRCTIKHKSEIADLDAFRKERDSFYFSQVFDRFIRRWYECIPVKQIINVPEKVKKALDERWKFIVVEIGRVKELTSAVKTCKRCARFCASNDSVDCAICKNSYHMNCVQPPLPKKPSRGFAWACGPCSRASERKLEARNTPTVSEDVTEAEEEPVEEEPPASNDSTRAPSPSGDDIVIDQHPATQAEIALAKMWPMRYLGIHCRVEDALQYDDRAIYPRASSRLGPRHQANVNVWHGHPVELVKPAEIKKRYNKNSTSHKKDGKLTKETIAALEADREEKAKRPKWVQDEPPGYVARGEDYPDDDPRCTAKLVWKMPEEAPAGVEKSRFVDDYVRKAQQYSRVIGVPPFGTNFLDKLLELLTACKYDTAAASSKLSQIDRKKDLHEPVLTKSDLVKFEEGVAKYGSEHRLIRLHMKTNIPNSDIVRFYYLWKKTPKGREIWGNYGGRKGSKRKIENDSGAKIQAEIAYDADDSAFDADKAVKRHRGFVCKFCNTAHARQWRKAPGVSPGQTVMSDARTGNKDKKEKLLLALCLRCAGLWRKYAIQWEDIDEVAKKVAQGGGRAFKRRIDEELLRELIAANEAANAPPEPLAVPSIEQPGEPPKKKSKMDSSATSAAPTPADPVKKKEKPAPVPTPPKEPTPPPPPIIPNQPVWKTLPCAICKGLENTIECAHCKLTIHRRCFGVREYEGVRPDGSVHWICEQCQNDRHPEVSTDYACCLCLTEETLVDLVEPPKVSHKKKTDREREKERMEKELADGMRTEYRNRQLSLHRPVLPREPLKKTTGNNWVHVQCAVWTPEIRFSDAEKLEVAEGFQMLPPQRYEAVCKLCKNKDHNNKAREDAGACVSCFQCQANFHASCAWEAGYQFGFDVTPVKNSRKDQVITAKLGEETGLVVAGIWCKEHVVKSIIHPVNEVVDETGKTALQVFVENYKQADLALTGTVRKANLAQLTKEKGQQAVTGTQNGNRRESAAHSVAVGARRGARNSLAADTKSEAQDAKTDTGEDAQIERRCVKCDVDVTPKWHLVVKEQEPPTKEPTPASSPPKRRLSMTLGEIADLERQRSQEAGRSTTSVVDITGAPVPRPPSDPARPAQNIRFMPPGASGRAWDGMHNRTSPRPTNGDAPSGDQSAAQSAQTVHPEPAVPPSNGEIARPPFDEDPGNSVYHSSGLPRFQNPALRTTPPPESKEDEPEPQGPQEWMCHKCFVKKKVDPTPPPSPSKPEPAVSPPRQFSLQLEWNRTSTNAPHLPRDGPVRMPWDDPPPSSRPNPLPSDSTSRASWSDATRPSQAPPSSVNGIGPQPPTFGSHAASQGSGYPPYGSQSNGYHVPPPVPAHHARQPSLGYGPPPPTNGQFGQHSHSRSPMPGYPPVSQPLTNGIHSPHGGHPNMQSPGFGPSMAPQHHQFPPRRTESPFSSQLPPIAQPLHSSPQAMFNRPDAITHSPAPPQPPHHQPPPAQQQQFQQPSAQPRQQQAPSNPNIDPALTSGTPAPPSDSQQARPTTPPAGQTNGTTHANLGPGGASASPSLRNLLH
ncbi:hypothetical protein EJ03DRAFT_325177 [Teratosphaeria nubilosa]|uniref:BAH-domain-containing protein n=1 Tax=Teratosphaeria nubilosa TaxID=161662 RepID=A0A6G1LGD5_9PEZI|nr:hypothetical protein EJ03DRAFT_325177 [Teratosphaeria nubilosa]